MKLPEPEIIAEAVAPDAAIEFWKQRAKLTDAEARTLGADARHRAFYVTGLAKHDLVQLVSDGIQSALENGETLADFKGRIAEAIQAEGWHDYRIENIFRTNLQTAYSAGRYQKMQEVKASRPYWQYLAVMDRRVRPSHAILHHQVYPADHEFWGSNYPPNGFRCRCGVRTLSARQVKKMGLTVQQTMPEPGVWTDPKTGMEYFVNFPGADKGFRNNPGKNRVAGLDLAKYPDLTPKSYEEQRKGAALRPAPVTDQKALGEQIKARCSGFATNAGIHAISFDQKNYFMATDAQGKIWISGRKQWGRDDGHFTPAQELFAAWNKLAEGKPLNWNEEYSLESLWHEITHNQQKHGRLARNSTAESVMEVSTQWTARRTYHEMVESLGGKAAHQSDILKNGLGYGAQVRRFDRLLDALKVSDNALLPHMRNMMKERSTPEYPAALAQALAELSGAKKSAVKRALSHLNDASDFEEMLRLCGLTN